MNAKSQDSNGKWIGNRIHYFSDLFIMAMVCGWLFTLLFMLAFSIYATIGLSDTSVWGYVENLVTIPLSCGGAVWMIKNSVQHAIANYNGKDVPLDFPEVPGTEEAVG